MSVQKITPKELHERFQSERMLLLLDVRAEEKYNDYHIEAENKESRNIPKTIIFGLEEGGGDLSRIDLPTDREIVVTCTTGNSAAKCANILSRHHDSILLLEGGVTAWKEYINSHVDK